MDSNRNISKHVARACLMSCCPLLSQRISMSCSYSRCWHCISHCQPSPGSCSKTHSTVHMVSLLRNSRSSTGFVPDGLGEGCTGLNSWIQMYLEPRACKIDMFRQHMEKLQRCFQHIKTMSPALAGVEIRLVLSIDVAMIILEQSEFPRILVIIWASNKFTNTSPRINI